MLNTVICVYFWGKGATQVAKCLTFSKSCPLVVGCGRVAGWFGMLVFMVCLVRYVGFHEVDSEAEGH